MSDTLVRAKDTVIMQEFVNPDSSRDLRLLTAFNESVVSVSLDAMLPRYAPKHNPKGLYDISEFRQDFGLDVDHRTHPIVQRYVSMGIFARQSELDGGSTLDRAGYGMSLCSLAFTAHDFGEAPVRPGTKEGEDIPFGEKTIADEQIELDAYHWVMSNIPHELEFGDYIKIRKIIFDESSILHQLFTGSEMVNYIRTATRAHEIMIDDTRSDNQRYVAGNILLDVNVTNAKRYDGFATAFQVFDEFRETVVPGFKSLGLEAAEFLKGNRLTATHGLTARAATFV